MIHWFDLFVIVFLLVFTGISWYRGFVKELFSISSLVIGYVCASQFYLSLSPSLKEVFEGRLARDAAAFAIIFFGAIFLVTVIGFYMRRWLRVSEVFGTMDKIGGMGMGFMKGALILGIVIYPLALVPGITKDFTKGSISGPYINGVSGAVMEKVAPGLAGSIEKANKKSGVMRKRAGQVEKFRKTVDKIEAEIKDKTKQVKSKLGLDGKSGAKTGEGEPQDEITESDKKELDNLLKKLN